MRSLSQNTLDILASRSFIMTELIEFEFDTELYLTTAAYDIVTSTPTSNGNQTYLAQGDFLSLTGVSDTDEVRVNTVQVTVQAATNKFRNVVLNGNFLHRTFRIYKALINPTTMMPAVDPILIYSGQITGASATDTVDSSTVEIATASEFYDFERVAGRKTNDGSQQRYFPGDRGMEYATIAIADIAWGKKT